MSNNKYIPTIGLEIHAELRTDSKMFCSCPNNPDEEKPNVNVCPICLGHPGTLPVLNFEAIKHVLKVGLAVKGLIADFTEWDRKNYFYPDIPKGYQISQYKYPLVSGGSLADIEIERIHLEEDTAQSTHDTHAKSLVNFNRAGVPLMELVTKPVIHEAATAVLFAKELQLLLRSLKAGKANLEKGEMRIEANISIASPLDTAAGKLGTKTEVKNLNSFKVVEKSIAYEIERQARILEEGGTISQETRGYDENTGETYSQRSKESSHDYRYFPEPDIPKLKLSEIKELSPAILQKELPELPSVMRGKFKKDYSLTDKEVAMLVDVPEIASYFQSVISHFENDQKKIRLTVNYILNNYLGKINLLGTVKDSAEISTPSSVIQKIEPKAFAELIELLHSKTVSSSGASALIDIALTKKENFSGSFKQLAEENNLVQNSNSDHLNPIIEKVLADNSKVVAEYKAGKLASLQFLVGQVMKASKGSANPETAKELLLKKMG